MAELPQNLAENSKPHDGVLLRQVQAANKPADALIGVGYAAAIEEPAFAQGFAENFSDAFDFRGGRERCLFEHARSVAFADQFIQADGHGLPQIHRDVFLAGGNADEPVAVAQIVVRQAKFLRAEKQRHAAGAEAAPDLAGALLDAAHRMVQMAVAHGCGPDDQRAVAHSRCDGIVLLGAGEKGRGAHGGARFAKASFVRMHHAQAGKAEIAHGAGGRSDIERVARGYEHHAEAIAFGCGEQGTMILMQQRRSRAANCRCEPLCATGEGRRSSAFETYFVLAISTIAGKPAVNQKS